MRTVAFSILRGIVAAILVPLPAFADPPHWAAAVSGRVTDTTGTPLAEVRVTVAETQRSTTTDLEGRYAIPDLPSGSYSIAFALVGYAPQIRRVVVRETDLTVDVVLRPTAVELPELQVTASAAPTTLLTSPQPVGVLGEAELQSNRAASLGETISGLPGVRSLSTGTGIGKPVIRGLSSNRVLVLVDGQRLENQQWGEEHGPQIEAAEASRIEVIRGPASVLYGSDALGGVVNVITPPLPDAIGRPGIIRGSVLGSYSTNNDQPDGTLMLEGARDALGARVSLTGRRSDDIRTPRGRLFNSGGHAVTGTGTVGYRGGWGTVSLAYTRRDERTEIHEDSAEEPEATPHQRIGEDRVHLSGTIPSGGSHFDLDLGYERNRRREFEEAGTDQVALGLLSRTYSADVRLHHAPLGRLEGILGLSLLRNEFEKFGTETLIPDNAYDSFGAYLFEQTELNRWELSFGLRYDHRRLDVEADEELGVTPQRRTYNSVTGNVGVLYRLAEPAALVLNLGRGFRAPSAFDLFSRGVHEGTVRFERGDSTLRNETSINLDLALRIQTGGLSAELGGFANYIDDFIYPSPTAEIDPESGYQIFDITQGNARLTGFEAAVEYHPTPWLHLRGTADYVRGQNVSTDQPLPFIPPFRTTYGVRLEGAAKGWLRSAYLSFGGESNARQTRLDPHDFAPAGYTLLHVGGGVTLPVGRRDFALDLQLRNALDERYANFLSRYKTYALDPGRNLVVRISTEF